MSDAPPYRPCTCGAGCKYHGTPGQPCWGECIALGKDADGKWIHVCEGHNGVFYERDYVPPMVGYES